MKKFLLATTLLLGITATKAQDAKNVVKINPIGIFLGSASLAYERAVSNKSSILVAPSFGYLSSGGDKYTTYGLGVEYRVYFTNSKYAPRGWYVGPGAAYYSGTVKSTDSYSGNTEKIDAHGFALKAICGHQWIWSGGFTLDLNAGVQYLSLKVDENNEGIGNFSGVLPALGVSVGYAF